jgi:hypothetical protein
MFTPTTLAPSRSIERVGFVREGLMRHASLIDGVFRDAILMAIVEREAPQAGRPRAADVSVTQPISGG